MPVIRRGSHDFDQAPWVLVDPAAGVRVHFECGRNPQQTPGVADFNKDPLPMAAEEPEIAVTGGEKTVNAHMALGDH